MDFNQHTIIESRTDIRILASLAKFYTSKGITPRTRSSLVSIALEDFVLLLQKNKHLTITKQPSMAILQLRKLGFHFYKRQGRTEQSIIKDLQIETKGLHDDQTKIAKAAEEHIEAEES